MSDSSPKSHDEHALDDAGHASDTSDPSGEDGRSAQAGEGESGNAVARSESPQGPPPTPFDHPLFLPALLVAGMIWFGYDGWINQDPDMLEHQDFNRWGFGALTLAAAWFGFKGWREWQAERAAANPSAADRPPPIA